MKSHAALVCAIAASGCVAETTETGRGSDAPSDATVRAAVIRTIADSARSELRIDSLSLPTRLDRPSDGTVPTSSDMRGNGGMDRLGEIWDGALRSMPDTVRHHCAGALAPPYAGNRSGCPGGEMTVVVLGWPSHATAV